MTDKQIIIDGVDVSGCPYYIDSEGSCSSQDCECIKCIHNVCFYKDYKAKEQECEELKEAIDRLLKIQYQLADSCTKYEQTLTKIKEIVEGMHDLWINKTPYTDMDNLVKHLLECELNRIRYKLDEISECEVNNDR